MNAMRSLEDTPATRRAGFLVVGSLGRFSILILP
jgi:hypothetical protein